MSATQKYFMRHLKMKAACSQEGNGHSGKYWDKATEVIATPATPKGKNNSHLPD